MVQFCIGLHLIHDVLNWIVEQYIIKVRRKRFADKEVDTVNGCLIATVVHVFCDLDNSLETAFYFAHIQAE